MRDQVKVPTAYLQTWRRNLNDLSRKHPMEFPDKMRELLQEIGSYAEKATRPLQDISKAKLETWKDIVEIYLSLAIEHFMLPPSLYDLVDRIANHLTSFTMPHIRCVAGRKAFRIEQVKPHYYGGFELALSDSDVVEVDLTPLSSCTKLKQVWLVLENVQSIDLTPLMSCTDLETLYISIGKARELDLKPLARCANLRNLDLLVRGLYELDLTPLSNCTHLRSLNISSTSLNIIDLKPLRKCRELTYLCLDSNNLSELDLAPMASCQSLNSLSFEKNYIKEIDLEPLGFCKSLQYLGIGHNSLSEIDLSPLVGNTKLRKVKIDNNRITDINLEPLGKVSSLAALDIGTNRLDEVDLSPLSGLSALEEISLNGNSLSSLSTMPLAGCKRMKTLDFRKNPIRVLDISGPLCAESKNLSILVDRDTKTQADSILRVVRPSVQYGEGSLGVHLHWRPVKNLLRESGWKEVNRRIQIYMQNLSGARKFAAKREFLKEFGLAEISGLDKDITPLLNSVKSRKSLKSIKQQLYSGIVDLLQEQLEEGGSTFFLDREIIGETNQVLKELITERRAQEINDVVIPVKKSRVHLEPLWLTVYGFDALKNLNMPVKTTTAKKFEEVEKALADKGFKLKAIEYRKKRVAKKYSVKMSRELKEYILKLAGS